MLQVLVDCKILIKNIKLAISQGATHFISGMALGVDMWAAEAIIELKEKGLDITLEAALPHKKQSAGWNASHKARYTAILKKCDKITCVSEHYTHYCMMKRNQYMVDSSDLVIAVTDDFSGGSGKTVLYARSKNVPVRIISI